jgi:hypothetical protein
VCSPKLPTPPDPKETAAAQTGTNIGTAIAQGVLNQTNQVTPSGSLTYNQTGTYKYTDPTTGQSYDLPQYTATQTLSPEQQKIFATTQGTQQNLADIGQQQSGFLKDYLSTPVDLSSGAIDQHLFDLGKTTLDPQFSKQQQDLEQSLANRGLKMGSGAYTQAMSDFAKTRGQAYNDLLLSGHGQAVSDILAQRNQPINEISALLNGSQVTQPSYVSTPQTNLPTTDYAGLVETNYNQKLQQ